MSDTDGLTDKSIDVNDASQVLGYSFNRVDNSLSTSSFLVGKVGRKIEVNYVDSVTEEYSYYEGTDLLYTLQLVYTDSSKDNLASAERTA